MHVFKPYCTGEDLVSLPLEFGVQALIRLTQIFNAGC